MGLDVVIFIFSNMAAVVRAGQASVKLLVVILYICFSINSGSGLDVFQIPQHRKALFVACNTPLHSNSMRKIKISDAFEHFSLKHNDYKKLGDQICRQVNDFLRQEKILSLNTDYRIKEKDRFIEKIKRKHYDDPINQMEDFCGIRVVCFYSKDISKICEYLERNFIKLEAIDKSSNLNHDKIGYRSWHYIVKLKDTICQEDYFPPDP